VIELAHRADGAEGAPVLVLAPSLGTTIRLWEPQLDAFAERFQVVRHDHPGHGGSPVPGGRFSVEDEARALLALLDGLGIERFSFCGISLGGMVGMWVAALAPERVETLTLCCTGAKLGELEDWRERARLVRDEGTEALVQAQRARWFSAGFRDTAAADACLDELRHVPREGYALCAEAVGGFDFRDKLGRIEVPTLVVAGEADPTATPAVIQALADGIAGARVETIPGAGHLANVERPDLVAAAVLSHAKVAA
jgi:3-oxoadipate enol-lactonase